jgi:hypothetical protein
MTEGKLKKRIWKEAGYTGPYVEIVPESLLKILEDTAKEFRQCYDYYDRIDWFLKCFGDSK